LQPFVGIADRQRVVAESHFRQTSGADLCVIWNKCVNQLHCCWH